MVYGEVPQPVSVLAYTAFSVHEYQRRVATGCAGRGRRGLSVVLRRRRDRARCGRPLPRRWRPAIPPEVNGVQVGEVVPLAGSLDVDQTSRAGGASRRSRQQDMGFRRLPENSGAQVQNLDHMKHSGITQPTVRSREA